MGQDSLFHLPTTNDSLVLSTRDGAMLIFIGHDIFRLLRRTRYCAAFNSTWNSNQEGSFLGKIIAKELQTVQLNDGTSKHTLKDWSMKGTFMEERSRVHPCFSVITVPSIKSGRGSRCLGKALGDPVLKLVAAICSNVASWIQQETIGFSYSQCSSQWLRFTDMEFSCLSLLENDIFFARVV